MPLYNGGYRNLKLSVRMCVRLQKFCELQCNYSLDA